MLDKIRKHSGSFFVYLIFGAIIVVFAINFGPGSGSCSGTPDGNFAAVVNGEVIPSQQFALSFGSRVEWQRRRMQAANLDLSNEMLERMGLRKQVIDELVDQKLLAQEARRRGLRVSDEELFEFMNTRYAVEKVGDKLQYENWVGRNFETTVQRFEADTRDEILGQKMLTLLTHGLSVSDDELRVDFLRENDRAMVTYVQFNANLAAEPPAPAAAVTQLLAKDMAAVEAKYNAEGLRYRTPQKVHARQIMRKLPVDASEAEVAKARGLLLDLKGQIDSGADFAALAKEQSEDVATAMQGGDLGFFQRGERLAAVEAAAFGLKKDEIIAEPVRSTVGLHLIQVTEIKPPERQPLDEVKRDVAGDLLRERSAAQKARGRAEALLKELAGGKAIDALTVTETEAKDKTDKPVRHETSWVLKSQDSIPRIGASPELHEAIFALTREAPLAKQVFQVNQAYYLVVLKDREVPDLAKFESDKENQRRYAISAKQSRVFRAWIENLREKANVELSPQLFPPTGEQQG